MNRILSILGGVIGGIIVISLVEYINMKMYPVPAGIDVTDPAQLEIIMHMAPNGALLMIILAWLLGSFAAGAITKLISKTKTLNLSMISGGILMLFGLIQLLTFFHPLWFWIVGLFVFLPAAFLGYKSIRIRVV